MQLSAVNRCLIVFLCVCFLFLDVLKAQEKYAMISGYVRDAITSESISGAAIVISGHSEFGAITDTAGFFMIDRVPVGYHDLQISFLGYETFIEKSVYVSTGRENVLDIALQPADNFLEDIVVRSSPATASDLSIVKLQPQKQGERLAGGFNDIGRMLQSYAGVKTILDGSNQLVVRGTGPLAFGWRINGIPMGDPNHFSSTAQGGGAVGLLSTYVLDKADFYSGAIPAAMGNALSGVMDMQLRKGDPNNSHFNIRLGLIGLDAMAEGPFTQGKKSSYLFNYRFSTITLIEKMGINIHGTEFTDGELSTYFQDFAASIAIPLKKNIILQPFLIGGVSKAVNGFTEQNLRREDNFYLLVMGGLQMSQVVNGRWRWNTTYATDYVNFKLITANKYPFPFLGEYANVPLDNSREDARTLSYKLSASANYQPSPRHSLSAGLLLNAFNFNYAEEYYNYGIQDLDSDGVADTLFVQDTSKANSSSMNSLYYEVYCNWQFKISKEWLLEFGLQYNQFIFNDSKHIEPRLKITYEPADKHKLTIAAGMQSRLMPYAYYGAYVPWYADTRPNRNTTSERVIHLVAGYGWQFAADYLLKGEVYYQYLYKIPVELPGNPNYDPYYSALNDVYPWYWKPVVSQGNGRNYGLEITLEKSFSRLYYIISTLSIYSTQYKTLTGGWNPTIYDGRFIYNISGGKDFMVGKNGSNLISVNSKIIWAGGGRYRTVETQNNIDYYYTPGYQGSVKDYFRWDIKAGYKRNKTKVSWELSAEIQNITNTRNELKREFDFINKQYNISYHIGLLPNLKFSLEI